MENVFFLTPSKKELTLDIALKRKLSADMT